LLGTTDNYPSRAGKKGAPSQLSDERMDDAFNAKELELEK
jgi:hypothetical protein